MPSTPFASHTMRCRRGASRLWLLLLGAAVFLCTAVAQPTAAQTPGASLDADSDASLDADSDAIALPARPAVVRLAFLHPSLGLPHDLRRGSISEAAYSRPASPADSLPDGMPLNTRLLWGRHGLLRSLGLAPSTRAAELELRRSMLQWHQRLGLATFGAMTTQLVLGELMAADPARYYASLRPTHRTLGYVTFGAYMTTAGLSVGAPPARRYGDGISSVRLHRYLAIVHFVGMVAQPWLGHALGEARTAEDYDRLLGLHQWTGRITYAAFTTAILTIFLPY